MPISPDSQYCLDSCVELCQITVDNADFFYRTEYDIDRVLDSLETRSMRSIEQEFWDLYRRGYSDLQKMDRGSLNLSFLLGSSQQFREIETTIATSLIEGKSDNDSLEQFGVFFDKCREGYDRCQTDMFTVPIRSLVDYETERRYRLQVQRDAARDRVRDEILESELGYPIRKDNRSLIKKGKSVVKKSLRTLERLAGSETTRLFVRGEEIIVQGKEFSFRFQKNPEFNTVLASATPEHRRHISFKLDLLTATGDYLATGCVYVPDTPVLDQVTGLMLHIRSGNEQEIVRVTNWFGCSEEFLTYAPLKIIRDQKAAEIQERFREHLPQEIVIPNPTENFGENYLNNLLLPFFHGGRYSDAEREAQADFIIRRDETKPKARALIKTRLNLPENFSDILMSSDIQVDELQMLDCDNRVRSLVIEHMEKIRD